MRPQMKKDIETVIEHANREWLRINGGNSYERIQGLRSLSGDEFFDVVIRPELVKITETLLADINILTERIEYLEQLVDSGAM